ncbi:MAG: peptidoglycan-binding protein, partial [Paracoccus sp. (in: a-proteobacteria)]
MRTLRYQSRGQEVYLLEEILQKFGYPTIANTYFDLETLLAVKDFQTKNNLVVDGVVGPKTWAVLLQKQQALFAQNDKFLSEDDLKDFAHQYDLELATIKAVNEIESTGRGFLIDGRPKILFEGHVFWKQLQ